MQIKQKIDIPWIWLVTLNPNKTAQAIKSFPDEKRKKFIKGFDEMNVLFSNEKLLNDVIKGNDYIKLVGKTSASIEVGSKQHRIHAHYTFITHKKCMIDYNKVRKFAKYFYPGCHINFLPKPDIVTAMKLYAAKSRPLKDINEIL